MKTVTVQVQKPLANKAPKGAKRGAKGATQQAAQTNAPTVIQPVTAPATQVQQPPVIPPTVTPTVTQQAPAPVAPLPIKYAIVDYARPKAGSALFAHTSAFFKLSGMDDGGAYPKAKALQVIGATAVKYHTANGNLYPTDKGLVITPKGKAFFAARGAINPELQAAFIEVMTLGTVNDKANVKSISSRIEVK